MLQKDRGDSGSKESLCAGKGGGMLYLPFELLTAEWDM